MVFSSLASVCGNAMKHCLSCLTFYMNFCKRHIRAGTLFTEGHVNRGVYLNLKKGNLPYFAHTEKKKKKTSKA